MLARHYGRVTGGKFAFTTTLNFYSAAGWGGAAGWLSACYLNNVVSKLRSALCQWTSVSGKVSVKRCINSCISGVGTRHLFRLFLPHDMFVLLGLIQKLPMIPLRLLLILHGVLSMLYKACQEYLCFCDIFPLFWKSRPSRPVWTLIPALVVAQDQEWQEFTCTHLTSQALIPLLFPSQLFVLLWEPSWGPYLNLI